MSLKLMPVMMISKKHINERLFFPFFFFISLSYGKDSESNLIKKTSNKVLLGKVPKLLVT